MADTVAATGGVLGHICPDCNHASHEHGLPDQYNQQRCRWPTCSCVTSAWAWITTPTVVYPLYLGEGPSAGTPILGVAPPGESVGGYQSCACDNCRDRWRRIPDA